MKFVRFRLNAFADFIEFLFTSMNMDAPSSIGESVEPGSFAFSPRFCAINFSVIGISLSSDEMRC